MEPSLDRDALVSLLEAAGRQLTGEWLLVGGAAAALWFDASRRTEDVDLIGLLGTRDERLALMQFAVSQGHSVETVNSAADFFVRQIPDWEQHLVVLHQGPQATIYRPSATLFLLLKIGRLSEKDLGDCRELLAHAREVEVDFVRVRQTLASLPVTDDVALHQRRVTLKLLLEGG